MLETKLEPFLSPMKKTVLGNKRNSESSLTLVLSEDGFCTQHKHLPEYLACSTFSDSRDNM